LLHEEDFLAVGMIVERIAFACEEMADADGLRRAREDGGVA
jgi:hypothetical protein